MSKSKYYLKQQFNNQNFYPCPLSFRLVCLKPVDQTAESPKQRMNGVTLLILVITVVSVLSAPNYRQTIHKIYGKLAQEQSRYNTILFL